MNNKKQIKTKFNESEQYIDNACIGTEVVNFKKTHVCTFVEISKVDMAILVDDMKNTIGSGLVFLESWEYEDLEHQWHICFNDFIYIHVRARRRSIVPMDQKGEERNSVSIAVSLNCSCFVFFIFQPRCEKTGFRGFRPGPTQTKLYNHRKWLET